MEKQTIKFETDPRNYTDDQVTMMKEALEKSFHLKDHSYFRFAETPSAFVTIVLSVITTLLVTDLYNCVKKHAKRFAKGFVNPKTGDEPTLSVLFQYRSIDFCAEIRTSSEEAISLFLRKLPDLMERIMTLTEKVEVRSKDQKISLYFNVKSNSFDLTPLITSLEKK